MTQTMMQSKSLGDWIHCSRLLENYVKKPAYSVCSLSGMIRLFGSEHSLVDSQKQGVSQQLVMLVKQVLGPGSSIPDPLPIDAQLSDLGISSLKMVNLMLAVELEFDIAIPQSDITPENFHSLASIEALVTRTLGLRRPA